jgi:hypothetical protein
MKKKSTKKRRPSLAQQCARLERANDRRAAYLKAHPPIDFREVFDRAFAVKGRHA